VIKIFNLIKIYLCVCTPFLILSAHSIQENRLDLNANIFLPAKGKIIKNYGWERFNSENFKHHIVIQSLTKSIYAAANGEVVISGIDKENKKIIVIQSKNFYTVYRNIDKFFVKKRDKVTSKTKIAEAAELYFELRDLNGNSHDPEKFFQKRTHLNKIKLSKKELFDSFFAFMENLGFSKKDIPVMYCIANLESSFNPKAVNYNRNNTYDTGIFQINDIWLKRCKLKRHELFDVKNNAICARLVLKEQGFNAWVTYKKYYPKRC